MNTISPRHLSLLLHITILVVFYIIIHSSIKNNTEQVNVPVIFAPPTAPLNLKEIKKEAKIILKSVNKVEPVKGKSREVFGINRNSYTEKSNESSGIAVKMGNTTAKVSDNKILNPSDSDSLPEPTEDYLVSQMPRVINEVRPVYPKEAREKQLFGSVVLDVLIDELGNVRQVNVIESAEVFRKEAVEAMRKFKFSPANINGKAVAVKIRYVIKFKLEF